MLSEVYQKERSDCQFSLSDLHIIERLGRGATSYVFKVSLNRTTVEASNGQSTYVLFDLMQAMKVIDKNNPRYQQISEALTHEINIHSKLDHPHIVKLNGHIEDRYNHYILMEYCKDGEATQLLGKQLTESALRLVSYQVALGLRYLHQQFIIHGDLKPTNILVSGGLFKKLCDFGFSTKLATKESRKSRACGTPVFMAPEIVNRQPYGMEVDCWSFGICMLLWHKGSHPYKAKTEQYLIKEIKSCSIDYPDNMSSELKQLLQNILVAEPEKRLTIQQILEHPFYTNHIQYLEKEYYRLFSRNLSVKVPTPKERRSKLIERSLVCNDNEATLKKVKSSGDIRLEKILARNQQLDTTVKRNTSDSKSKPSKDNTKRVDARGLQPQTYQTGKAKASVLEDNSFEIDLDGVRMVVSNDGYYIKVYEAKYVHVFFRYELPDNYLKLYLHAAKLITQLRENPRTTVWKVEESEEGTFEMLANRRDFRGVIGRFDIRHNTLEYLVSVREVAGEPIRLHPIEYVCRNNNSLEKALRLFLKKYKQFLKNR